MEKEKVKSKEKREIPIDWKGLIKDERKISILVDNPLPEHKGEGKESYVGYPQNIENGFLFLHTPNNNRIHAIIIRLSMILSIWIYNQE
jgi:hypothetical protein